MKINISINFEEFHNDFESFADYTENVVKAEIEKQIKNHPDMKNYIKEQADKAVEKALATQ
ncbi:MAG TPA: hypothetical protein ENH82_07780 [bacterium]|nr:hypothetical protein [bacterium]